MYKEPRRISITKPILFKRAKGSGEDELIVWIREIKDDGLYMARFVKKNRRVLFTWESKKTWQKHIKSTDPNTYKKIEWTDVSSRRKKNALIGILES